jgi:multidrug resistance efflux pump
VPADTETAEPEVDEATEAGETEDSGSSGLTLEGLNDKLDRVMELLKNGASPRRGTKADDAADVAAQVRSEVGKLRAAEKKDAAKQGELDSLRETVAKLAERAPVEYRRITTILWGDPDD